MAQQASNQCGAIMLPYLTKKEVKMKLLFDEIDSNWGLTLEFNIQPGDDTALEQTAALLAAVKLINAGLAQFATGGKVRLEPA